MMVVPWLDRQVLLTEVPSSPGQSSALLDIVSVFDTSESDGHGWTNAVKDKDVRERPCASPSPI